MDRPSRNKKTVNYSDFLGDDDEDFATVKAPPNKKARAFLEPYHEEIRKPPNNSAKEIIGTTGKRGTERVCFDENLYKRDLEAALSLSMLQRAKKVEDPLTSALDDEKCMPPVLTHCSVDGSRLGTHETSSNHPPQDSPPVLSNCSVDVGFLDQITSEPALAPVVSSQRKTSKSTKHCRRVLQDEEDSTGDEDYNPQDTPESDANFSEPDESEDEEYSAKRKGERKKTNRNEKTTTPNTVNKEKKNPKLPKAKPQSTVSKAVHTKSPSGFQSVSALKRTPITPPTPKLAHCSSPAAGTQPKWNPPGKSKSEKIKLLVDASTVMGMNQRIYPHSINVECLLGSNPVSCQSTPVKSPAQGLRLGLSRLARVKPLHPNAAAH